MPENKLRILHGKDRDLLNLTGEKKYRIQVLLDTNVLTNPGGDNEITTNESTTIFFYELTSNKSPSEIIPEVKALLTGFEIAAVRFNVREKKTLSPKVITLKKVSGEVELSIHTRNKGNWYFQGVLLIPYEGMYNKIRANPSKWRCWTNIESE